MAYSWTGYQGGGDQMKYPKIETIYKRNDKFKVVATELRCSEFALINSWLITEKVDGTNIRVILFPDGQIEYRGRTDNAQMHPLLLSYLGTTFTPEKLQTQFEPYEGGWPFVILYGEGYGPKIQRGGKYRDDISFRLFDIRVDEWWLNWDSVQDVASSLEISTVPVLGKLADFLPTCHGELLDLLSDGSIVADQDGKGTGVLAEGIVARTDPLLFDRRGNRVMWKLKFKDF